MSVTYKGIKPDIKQYNKYIKHLTSAKPTITINK